MDSGNSGSMQSSSGADEEYDSRFFNHPPPQQQNHVVASFSNHLSHNLFDYLDPTQRLPSTSLLNLNNILWSNTRSESNQSNLLSQNQNFLSSQSIPLSNDEDHKITTNMNMVRNPKKRTRASRRAPTTVLTTDTVNFRAMVQEFTGIPAQPFTSSPFTRTRFDPFGSVANTSSSSPPPFLLRPFAQKLQPILHPFPPSSTSSISSSNFPQLSSSIDRDHVQPLNKMHNPIFDFQAQTTPRYPLGNSSILASKTGDIPPNSDSVESHLKMGVLEELGLKNMVPSLSSDGALLSRVNNNNMSNITTSAEWAQRICTINNNDGDHHGGERNDGKVNYSASEFHGEIEGKDCTVVARSEGMVESWINCSSD